SAPASTTAVLNADLSCPGAVYHVSADWNTVNGGTNAGQWVNSAYLGAWTNAALAHLSHAVTGLPPNTGYFYTFRATNAVDDLWATNVMSFGPSLGKDILTFTFAGLPAAAISGTNITLTVPLFVDITALAPDYTVSPNALPDAAFPSGAARDFTSPKTYTVTAQNGATQTYQVTVTKSSQPIAFNWISSWTNAGAAAWVAPAGVTSVRVLVVGGGGASGRGSASGGGGAGGMLYYGDEPGAVASSYSVTPGSTYAVTVGNGGAAGGTLIGTTCNGTDSAFGAVTAAGGGGGGNHWNNGAKEGNAGGSGGGGGVGGWAVGAGGAAAAGQGHAGGASDANGQDAAAGGGGGGAGAEGAPGTDQHGGNGGAGLTCSIGGAAVVYAGGGGGNAFSYPHHNGAGGAGCLNAGGGGTANGSAAGNAGRDGVVVLNYGGSPTVTLNGPTNNQVFAQGVPVSATSAVALGMSPYQVSFFMSVAGGAYALAGSVASAPYTVSLGTRAAGTYRIYATVTDGYNNIATSVTNTFTALGSAVNNPPAALAQGVRTRLGAAKAVTLAGSDPDGDPLTYAIVASPVHGTLSGTAPAVTYTPAVGYAGTDAFTFKVNDGTTDSAPEAVTVTVSAAVLAEDFEHEWADDALARSTNGWTSGVGDQSSIINPAAGYGPLPGGVPYPLAYDHSALRRVLQLNAGGDALLTPDTDAAFAGARVTVDLMANFEVRLEYPEAVSNNADAKTVFFLKADGASTNLYVLHGQREAGGFAAPAFTAVTNGIAPGTWHRLTVTLDATTNGTGAEAFRVLFDGQALSSPAAYGDAWKSRVFGDPCGPDGGTWFLSASRRSDTAGTNLTRLARVAFEGGGLIDDLVVSYAAPDFSRGTVFMLALVERNGQWAIGDGQSAISNGQ
ncbi:MAG: glycine-rich domain-containing protein, partial [bacterium]